MHEPTEPTRRRRSTSRRRSGTPALQAFLDANARPGGPLAYHETQGFLFALAAAPDLVPPSEWIPFVMGADEPPFASEAEGRRVLGALLELYNRILGETNRHAPRLPDDCSFLDDVMANFDDDAPIRHWSRGFLTGHSWLRECWDEQIPPDMEDEFAACMLSLTYFSSRRLAEKLIAQYPGTALTPEKLAATCRESFTDSMSGYARIGRTIGRLASVPSAQQRRPAEPGRNDPCPCGSGKKYKKCCLGRGPVATPAERAADRIRRIQRGIIPRLEQFLRSREGDEALDRAWEEFAFHGDFDVEGAEGNLFHPWVLYGWEPDGPKDGVPAEGRTVAELFMDEHDDELKKEEVAFLGATTVTPTTFHEVLEVRPGRGLRLRDVMLDTERDVVERTGSENLQVGDVIYARVVQYDDDVALIIDMGELAIPPRHRRPVILARRELREAHGELAPYRLRDEDQRLREVYLSLREELKPRGDA